MDKFDTAQQSRQAILDLANNLGRITSRVVFEQLGFNMDVSYRHMVKMATDGELARHGKNVSTYFTPIKTVTATSEEMRRNQYKTRVQNKAAEERKATSNRKKREPWRTVHLGSEREHPIKNQGGQGSLRRNVYIQSCMD